MSGLPDFLILLASGLALLLCWFSMVWSIPKVEPIRINKEEQLQWETMDRLRRQMEEEILQSYGIPSWLFTAGKDNPQRNYTTSNVGVMDVFRQIRKLDRSKT